MVPEGADCVMMVEDTQETAENLVVFRKAQTAVNICFQAENIKKGTKVLGKGVITTPAHIAVLASVGAVTPLVSRLPVAGIISTGDELVEPGVFPGRAQIRNSNAWQLEAQVRAVPAIAAYAGIVADDGPALRRIIDQALTGNDVVLLSGGVSMGDFDHVPRIMTEAGIDILFKSIAIQPGRPTVFGRKGDKFIFGLPGNPVSSFILFEVLVKPFLLRMMGHAYESPELVLPMGVDFSRKKSERKSLIPARIRNGAVFPVEYHGSAHINAYTMANGILVIEAGTTGIKQGDKAHVRLL
jgi:molybdopterin molybdotransferase